MIGRPPGCRPAVAVLAALVLTALTVCPPGCGPGSGGPGEAGGEPGEESASGEKPHPRAGAESPGAEVGEGRAESSAGEVVRLSAGELEGLELRPVEVREGSLSITVELPGEVQWNTDRLVHVSPRVTGVVAEVRKTLGDEVTPGDLLCVLDSREMGEARLEYLADRARFAVAEADFERARTVHENTGRLLEILSAKPQPDPDEVLEAAGDLTIGRDKNRLLTAFVRQHVNRRNFERTERLRERKIATEVDWLEAKGDWEVARADWLSTLEEVRFELEPRFLRARRDFRVAKTELQNSERALRILGVDEEEMERLADSNGGPDESISRTPLRSPIDGIVVDRHLTRGEFVDPRTRLYTLADLSTVWVFGRVYERDLRFLEVGQPATVRLDAFPEKVFRGVVDYLGSRLDPGSRTVEARVVLENPERRLRPGMFGAVGVITERHPEDTAHGRTFLVPLAALQRVGDGYAVFVPRGDGAFRPVGVQVVARSGVHAEIVGELEPGVEVVAGDTFLLKSELEKASLGGGHSH